MKDYTLIYNLYLANVIDRHLKICEKEKIWRDVFGFFSPKNDFTEKLVGERDFAQFPHFVACTHSVEKWKIWSHRKNISSN